MRVLCGQLAGAAGGTVEVCGWVHRRRRLGAVAFLVVRDRSGTAQMVVRERLERLAAVPEETPVRVTGTVVANAKAPGGLELAEPEIEALSAPAEAPPVELWRPGLAAGMPVLLDEAAVLWRHPARQEVWRVAARGLAAFRRVLDESGFTEVQTPKLVGGATESGADVFEVDYFGRPAYLAQSPQFFKQVMVGVFERVYETGPVFRAEPHDTVRHLAEYVSLDVELGFITDHRDVLAVLRDVLAGMSAAVGGPAVPAELPVIHFRDALRRVGAPADEPDLAPEHERALGAWAREAYGSDFLAVEGYPAAKRPFYTAPQPDDPRWTNSFDLLFRGVELVTGGQRLHRYEDYLRALAGRDLAPYEAYLSAFRHGMPPHGGFAIGLERWTARITGAANVREVTLFPRDLHRLSP